MIPDSVKISKEKKSLQFNYENSTYLILSAKVLRANSPSAENKNNLKIPDVKKFEGVLLKKIEKVGNYALRIIFSDGHNTGIYSWDYIYKIGIKNQVL
tara:strand:+ start:318 stop:611 length:294 start_codon:yes stop_codon:yes gene_type:complete